ncbi:hypothetical protein DRQ53_06915 [bacterium]|nr:MAG: hypothetical protein DRQ32_07510 [bacterium]RKZ16205.1 MAG: hypothetical protein DRQ53_06915 [bacterium]
MRNGVLNVRNGLGRILAGAGIALVAVLMVAGCECKCPEETQPGTSSSVELQAAKVHKLIISPVGDDPSRCTIAAETGEGDIEVMTGDIVLWDNQTGYARTITFDGARELFGVDAITVKKHGKTKVVVSDEADADKDNPHTYDSCDDTVAPPGIIVCPPSGC